MTQALRRLARTAVPPSTVLLLACVVVAVLAVATGLTAWLIGVGAALSLGMGLVTGLPAAAAELPLRVRLGETALAAAAAGLGVAAGRPWGLAAVVFATALAQAPFTASSAGLGMAPAVSASVLGSVLPGEHPVLVGLLVVVGNGLAKAVVWALRLPRRSVPVPWRLAVLHAVTFAVIASAVLLVAGLEGLPHAYWAVLVLAAAMRPRPVEARRTAPAVFVGTLVGLAVSAVVAFALPRPATIVALVACAVLMFGWALAGDAGRQSWFGTPVIVLLASSPALVDPARVAAERVLLTGVSVGLALLAAWLMRGLDDAVAPGHAPSTH